MTLKEKAEEAWNNYEYREGNLYSNCFKDGFEQGAKIAEEFAIGFADWLLINDTPENAEKWFGYTNKDMLNAFKEEKGL